MIARLRSFRLSPEAYRRVTLFALVFLVVIIVSGGAVRLTGSGLGCSEWPTCESGRVVAPLEYHAWIEFGNRLFTGIVSVAVMLAVLGSLVREPRRRDLTWWSLGLVAGVLAQIVLGAIVVKTELTPLAVSGHFLVSIALVWNAVVLNVRAGEGLGPAEPVVTSGLRRLSHALVALLGLVLVLGTMVTGSGPHSGDLESGEVDRLGFEISEITRVHSGAVWLLVATSVVAVAWAYRSGAPAEVRRWGSILLAAEILQGSIGYLQYWNGVPVLLVALHLLGSVLVWIAALRFVLAQRIRPAEAIDPLPATPAAATTGQLAPA
jgi:cytochrome c oxidase assembly protein subunit 15